MSTPLQPTGSSPETRDQALLQRLRVVIALAAVTLSLSIVASFDDFTGNPLPLIELLSLGVLVASLVMQWIISERLNQRRRAREAAFTRILSGLSRSVSPESIVQAIVDELHRAADADHVVVSRLRPSENVVETTLVASNAQVPPSRTLLPLEVLDPASARVEPGAHPLRPPRPEQLVADEIARRVRQAYGLARTLSAPLIADGRIVGALVLSRRSGDDWTAVDRRLLAWSAEELSAALARAYAFADAETRANTDALTGLPNRRYLEELMSVVGPRRRAGDSLGALMIDIDHFKRLNDRHGHATGDRVLHAVGQEIANAIRTDDTPARYGGEEFAVVLRNASQEQALHIAERIRHAIAAIPPERMGVRDPVSVSVGAAVSDAPDIPVEALLHRADRAMYRAKREGRDRVVLG